MMAGAFANLAQNYQQAKQKRQYVAQQQAKVYSTQARNVTAQAAHEAARLNLKAARTETGVGKGETGVGIALVAVAAFLLLRQSVTTPSAATATVAPQLNCHATYVVRSWDTVSGIAAQYGVSASALVSANQVRYPSLASNPNLIQPGWSFCIP